MTHMLSHYFREQDDIMLQLEIYWISVGNAFRKWKEKTTQKEQKQKNRILRWTQTFEMLIFIGLVRELSWLLCAGDLVIFFQEPISFLLYII